MKNFTLTGAVSSASSKPHRIFCPSIEGLTPPQADLAFLMPRMDHNRILRETELQGEWAAVLASDPFGSEATMFGQLIAKGYRGVTNWPSSILLDGALQQSMSTIPASPEFEYAYLARAKAAGLQAMAFFRSLTQARAAFDAGLDKLVLHPGVLSAGSTESGDLILGSLKRLVEEVKRNSSDTTIFAYTSDWHENIVNLSQLPVDGFVHFGGAP